MGENLVKSLRAYARSLQSFKISALGGLLESTGRIRSRMMNYGERPVYAQLISAGGDGSDTSVECPWYLSHGLLCISLQMKASDARALIGRELRHISL